MARTAKKAKTEKVPEEEGKACPEGARSTSSNEGGNDGSNHDDSNAHCERESGVPHHHDREA